MENYVGEEIPSMPAIHSDTGRVAWQSFVDMIVNLGCFHVRLGKYPVFAKVVGYHFKPNGHIRSFGFITLITEFDGEIYHNPSACTIAMWESIGIPNSKGHFYSDCFVVLDESDFHRKEPLATRKEKSALRLSDVVSLNVRKGLEQWSSHHVMRIHNRRPLIEIGCYIKNDRSKGVIRRKLSPEVDSSVEPEAKRRLPDSTDSFQGSVVVAHRPNISDVASIKVQPSHQDEHAGIHNFIHVDSSQPLVKPAAWMQNGGQMHSVYVANEAPISSRAIINHSYPAKSHTQQVAMLRIPVMAPVMHESFVQSANHNTMPSYTLTKSVLPSQVKPSPYMHHQITPYSTADFGHNTLAQFRADLGDSSDSDTLSEDLHEISLRARCHVIPPTSSRSSSALDS
eukprot:TRINITY_DN2405_c1_g1_i1.p1 TRINITY_DN2405_c1_g1~~TRINITY_DN2405_c1_g1_i1.p1  ORF type:complete len:410 (+),score=96.52 TRINITY_DN2405_c1_g1_i1:42-1232(+)